MEELAAALTRRRRQQGRPTLRQLETLAQHKLSRSTIGAMLNGTRFPSYHSLEKLLRSLGVRDERRLKLWREAWSRVDETIKSREQASAQQTIEELRHQGEQQAAALGDALGAHRRSLAALYELAQAFAHRGEIGPAVELLERLRDLTTDAFGGGDDLTLTVCEALAMACGAAGHFDRAQALLRDCLRERAATNGTRDRRYLATMSNLAELHLAENNLPLAQEQHADTLRARQEVLGAADPDTIESMERLAAVLELRRDSRGAAALREEIAQRR